MASTALVKTDDTYDEDDSDNKLLIDCVNKVTDFYSDYNEHIERARSYLTFLYVDQWDLEVRQARDAASRPTLQFNKLVPIIRSILGEQRDNSPALTVRALGHNIKQDEIDIREGLLRQIAYSSDADIVYQVASKQALECGWGAARVVIEYENENSFKRCLKIKPVVDFQAAFFDSCAQEPDKSDGDYCGVYELMSKEKFQKYYPDIEYPESAGNLGDYYYIKWITRDSILVCEMYYKEYFTKTIVEMSDGKVLDEDEAKEVLEMQEKAMENMKDDPFNTFQPVSESNRREVRDYKMKHIKFIRNHILEKTDHPGKILPVVYFEGDSTVIDGERIPLPFVQDGIDEQRLINYIGSEMAYAVLRARKETVMGTPDNFKGFEDEWRNPDNVQGPLQYNFDNKAGKPEFVDPPVMNQMFVQIYQNCVRDLQENLGWFDEARGQETNAMSGKAIFGRQQASKKPVNVYNDNWQRGIAQIGKIQLELFPHVYDTEQTIMTIGADGSSKPVTINKRSGFRMNPDGSIEQNIENDMSFGKYDIEVRVDGSYDAQQAEAMNVLIKLATINPAIANLIPDLMAENSGLENSQQLVDRLKTLLPPQILAQEEGKPMPPPPPPPPIPPEVQVQQQKIQLGMQQNQTKQQQLALQEQKNMLDAHLAGVDSQTSLAKAAAEVRKAGIDRDIAILNHGTTLHSNTTQTNAT